MKDKFLEELRAALKEVHYPEVDDTIAYFDEMITDKMEEGLSIEAIIEGLGDVKSIAQTLSIEEENNDNRQVLPEPEEVLIDEESEEMTIISFDASNTQKIVINNFETNFKIAYGEDDKFKLVHDKSDSAKFVIGQRGEKVKIEYQEDYVASIFNKRLFKKTSAIKNAVLYLPRSFKGYLKYDGVSGDVKIEDLNIAELKIDNVSGQLELSRITSEEVNIESVSGNIEVEDLSGQEIDIDIVSGDMTIERLKGYELKLESVSGSIKAKQVVADFIKAESVSGSIDIELSGSSDDFAVSISGLFDDKKYNWQKRKEKCLKLETVSGHLEYRFI